MAAAEPADILREEHLTGFAEEYSRVRLRECMVPMLPHYADEIPTHCFFTAATGSITSQRGAGDLK